MQYVPFRRLSVSRFILGSNPFVGFSHQTSEVNQAMRAYFTPERIKVTMREAEALGVNTIVARADPRVTALQVEYAAEGGRLQWFAQTCPEDGSHAVSIERARGGGAKACYIHGGVMDNLYAQGRLEEVPPALELIRELGMLAGIAAHDARVIEWAEQHLDVDFYMCCYYNPTPRGENAAHIPGAPEQYLEEDRQAMTAVIQTLARPVIHYKILAAGRNDPAAAFAFAASKMRGGDAACVGVYPEKNPNMLREDVGLLEKALQTKASAGGLLSSTQQAQ